MKSYNDPFRIGQMDSIRKFPQDASWGERQENSGIPRPTFRVCGSCHFQEHRGYEEATPENRLSARAFVGSEEEFLVLDDRSADTHANPLESAVPLWLLRQVSKVR